MEKIHQLVGTKMSDLPHKIAYGPVPANEEDCFVSDGREYFSDKNRLEHFDDYVVKEVKTLSKFKDGSHESELLFGLPESDRIFKSATIRAFFCKDNFIRIRLDRTNIKHILYLGNRDIFIFTEHKFEDNCGSWIDLNQVFIDSKDFSLISIENTCFRG